MGRLLADVSTKMQHKVQFDSKDPAKLLVHTTHDSTLAALLCTFDVFDEKFVILPLSIFMVLMRTRWPPFTSSVTFELFRKQNPPEQQTIFQRITSSLWRRSSSGEMTAMRSKSYSEPLRFPDVRMRYKNRNMVLPMCAAPGNHLPGSPEFCTLSAFQERVKELTPKDWVSECFPRI
jgi:acid phosphatase